MTHTHESHRLTGMTKRLQVLLGDDELAEFQALARRRSQTTAAWVRDALRRAADGAAYPETTQRLRAVREAAAHDYPTGDMDEMLAQIERGYGGGSEP